MRRSAPGHVPWLDIAQRRLSPSNFALVTALLQRGIHEGCFASVNVEPAAALLLAAIHAATDAVLAVGDRTPWTAAYLTLARRYLGPATSGQPGSSDDPEGSGGR